MIGDLPFSTIIDRKIFAYSVNVTVTLINNLETITDLTLKNKGKFVRNDSEKYCGRSFYNGTVWFGIRNFENCRLVLGFFEAYNYNINKKPIQMILSQKGFKFFIVDTPIDKGHWYYIDFESICCFKYDEDRKEEIKQIIVEIMEELSI